MKSLFPAEMLMNAAFLCVFLCDNKIEALQFGLKTRDLKTSPLGNFDGLILNFLIDKINMNC